MKVRRILTALGLSGLLLASANGNAQNPEDPTAPPGPLNPNPPEVPVKKYVEDWANERGICYNYPCFVGWCCFIF